MWNDWSFEESGQYSTLAPEILLVFYCPPPQEMYTKEREAPNICLVY